MHEENAVLFSRGIDCSMLYGQLSLSAVIIKRKWNAIGILRDITERKQAEEQLQEAHEKLSLWA
ncbi:MAG: hypothetical protein V2A69_05290 [Pseudomonadota bacterium]